MSIIERAEFLLNLMREGGQERYTGDWLKQKSQFSVEEINLIVIYLETMDCVEIEESAKPGPYCFISVKLSVK
ncbi:MAG: hypothetical protein AB7S78_09105 [Candidatus Omnitrophota bacterium]